MGLQSPSVEDLTSLTEQVKSLVTRSLFLSLAYTPS